MCSLSYVHVYRIEYVSYRQGPFEYVSYRLLTVSSKPYCLQTNIQRQYALSTSGRKPKLREDFKLQ